jgi:hypothetical protein
MQHEIVLFLIALSIMLPAAFGIMLVHYNVLIQPDGFGSLAVAAAADAPALAATDPPPAGCARPANARLWLNFRKGVWSCSRRSNGDLGNIG